MTRTRGFKCFGYQKAEKLKKRTRAQMNERSEKGQNKIEGEKKKGEKRKRETKKYKKIRKKRGREKKCSDTVDREGMTCVSA